MTLALGIAGYSGAGKTTLIEALLPRLAARGLRIGVVKHDAHKLTLDHDGKDTARFFAAGAAVVSAHDPTQRFVRLRCGGPAPPAEVLAELPADMDCVLVEGHKDAPLPKLVLEHPDPRPAITGPHVIASIGWGALARRVEQAEQAVTEWLDAEWRARPLGVALLVGGRSSRMGLRKPLLDYRGRALLSHVLDRLEGISDRLVLVGSGALPPGRSASLPRLPDAPGLEGPMAGVLAAMRHDPERVWLAVGCDQPEFGKPQADWLLGERRPGTWAVLPRLAARSRPEPLGAVYEPPLRAVLERAVASGELALYRAVQQAPASRPAVPDALSRGWLNVNTAAEWEELTGEPPREWG